MGTSVPKNIICANTNMYAMSSMGVWRALLEQQSKMCRYFKVNNKILPPERTSCGSSLALSAYAKDNWYRQHQNASLYEHECHPWHGV